MRLPRTSAERDAKRASAGAPPAWTFSRTRTVVPSRERESARRRRRSGPAGGGSPGRRDPLAAASTRADSGAAGSAIPGGRPGRSPGRGKESVRKVAFPPSRSTSALNSSRRRDFPAPASPWTSTTAPDPVAASRSASPRTRSSSRLPRRGDPPGAGRSPPRHRSRHQGEDSPSWRTSATPSAEPKRFSGSLARSRWTTASRKGEIRGLMERSGSGSPRSWRPTTAR